MADDRLDLPPALRDAISRDLRPVKSLRRPIQRLLPVAPIAVVLLFASVIVFDLRRDASRLGFALTWGASIAQALLGLALVAAALRESVPGTTLSRRAVGFAIGTAIVAVLTITWTTWTTSATFVPPGFVRWVWSVCVAGTIVTALPALAVSGWLAARAFPLRPRVAGALYGVGAGLMADAGWRLFCHFSEPIHVFGAHTLGIVVVGLTGIGFAIVLGRRGESK